MDKIFKKNNRTSNIDKINTCEDNVKDNKNNEEQKKEQKQETDNENNEKQNIDDIDDIDDIDNIDNIDNISNEEQNSEDKNIEEQENIEKIKTETEKDDKYIYISSKKLLNCIYILVIILSFLLGGITGYFFGNNSATKKFSSQIISNSVNQNNDKPSTDNKDVETVDYSKYIINKKKNVTIANFYSDNDMKQYASKIIGTNMPKLTWKDKSNKTHDTNELGKQYIIEIFNPTCTYCQNSAPEVDKFRNSVKYRTVSLTTDDGDMSLFNKTGENAFIMTSTDDNTSKLMQNIPWIPTFLYVKDGQIKLITYGAVDQTTLTKNASIAFEQ